MGFLTGSHAYGTPHEKSDVDVVVLLTDEDQCKLAALADEVCGDQSSADDDSACSMRFGRINLICVADRDEYEAWRTATEDLKSRSPVRRKEAVERIQAALQAAEEKRQAKSAAFLDAVLAELSEV